MEIFILFLNSKNLLASIQYDFSDGTKRDSIEKKANNGQSKYDTNIIKRYIGMHGGELMLQGHNLTLVVFHGLNFKSRQWALFSLNEPQINFVTDRGENGDSKWILFILKIKLYFSFVFKLIKNYSSTWVIKDKQCHLALNLAQIWLQYPKLQEIVMKHRRI